MRAGILLLLLFSLTARSAMDISRELVAPEQLVPGQPVRVAVTFWTDSWFNPPPQWPEMTVRNGTLLNDAPPNQLLTRQKEGISWSGIRMERQILSWDSGTLRLPELAVTLNSAGQAPVTVTLPALQHTVAWPPDVRQPDRFLPARSLSLQQKWLIHRADAGETIHVGDVIERQVTLRASGVLPLQIPPLLFAVPGSSTRLTPVNSLLKSGRDNVTGAQRIETLRYLPSQPGTLTLPPVSLRWWDTSHQQWQRAELPAARYTIAAARADGAESVLRARVADPLWHSLLLVLVGAMILALWLLRRRVAPLFQHLYHPWLRVWRVVALPELAPDNRKRK